MQSKIVIIALCLGMASAAVWTGPNPVKPKEFGKLKIYSTIIFLQL